jgi:N-acetylglutamate synthase-like GNAT family acetyltransferase
MSSTQKPTIREMAQADIPNVKAFIKETLGAEGDSYPIASRIPVVIAEHNKNLIGAAAVYHNNLHPYWVTMLVAVAEPYRRQGLGRTLHDAALQARPLEKHHLGIKGDYCQGDQSAEAFLFAMGYQLTLDCHCVELNIKDFDCTEHLAMPSQMASHNLSITSLEELFLVPGKKQDVFDFLVSRYTEEHFWSPPQPSNYPGWQKIVFDRILPVLPELSFALLEGDRVVGAVTAGIANNDTLDIIWGYISRQYAKDEAVALLKCLYAHQFKAARDRSLYKADVEIDTTDKVSSTLLDWLPICNDKVWRILQKPRP